MLASRIVARVPKLSHGLLYPAAPSATQSSSATTTTLTHQGPSSGAPVPPSAAAAGRVPLTPFAAHHVSGAPRRVSVSGALPTPAATLSPTLRPWEIGLAPSPVAALVLDIAQRSAAGSGAASTSSALDAHAASASTAPASTAASAVAPAASWPVLPPPLTRFQAAAAAAPGVVSSHGAAAAAWAPGRAAPASTATASTSSTARPSRAWFSAASAVAFSEPLTAAEVATPAPRPAAAGAGVRRFSTAVADAAAGAGAGADAAANANVAAGVRSFKSPYKEGLVLDEKSIGQMGNNLQHLASRGRVPPVQLLHRMLARAETQEDLELCLHSLALCRTRFVKFTERTAALVVDACIRVGAPEFAYDVLRRRSELRLWPGRLTYHRLIVRAAIDGDADLFKRSLLLLQRSEHSMNARSYHIAVRGFVDLGDLRAAVRQFDRAEAAGIELKRGTLNVLANSIASASPDDLHPVSAKLLRAVVDATAAIEHGTSQSLAERARAQLEADGAAGAAGGAEAGDEAGDEGHADAEGEGATEGDAKGDAEGGGDDSKHQ